MCGVKTWNSCITGPTGQLELWYVPAVTNVKACFHVISKSLALP